MTKKKDKHEALDLALAVLELIRKETDRAREINLSLRDFDGGDFAPQISAMTEKMENAVVKLIDHLLEPDVKDFPIGSYWLYETATIKDGGKCTLNGKEYRIKTIADVRKYINATQKIKEAVHPKTARKRCS